LIRVSDSINQRPKKHSKKRQRVSHMGLVCTLADHTKPVDEDEVEEDQEPPVC